MALLKPKALRTRTTLSMLLDHGFALDYLSVQDGHKMPSRTVQRLVEEEAKARIGPAWRETVRAWAAEQQEAATV